MADTITRRAIAEVIREQNDRAAATPYSYTCRGWYNFRYETFDRAEYDSFVREFERVRRRDEAADFWRSVVRFAHPLLWGVGLGVMVFGPVLTLAFLCVAVMAVCFVGMMMNLP